MVTALLLIIIVLIISSSISLYYFISKNYSDRIDKLTDLIMNSYKRILDYTRNNNLDELNEFLAMKKDLKNTMNNFITSFNDKLVPILEKEKPVDHAAKYRDPVTGVLDFDNLLKNVERKEQNSMKVVDITSEEDK